MSSSYSSREDNVYMAKLADEAMRYEDMVDFMEKVVKNVDVLQELSAEERQLLYDACKNLSKEKRASWRILSAIEQKEEGKDNDSYIASIKECKEKIEYEMGEICDRILSLLDSHLIPSATSSSESMIFYLKMKSDFYRYLAEVKTGSEKKEALENALMTYSSAHDISVHELIPNHPTRLGLALNFSAFYHDDLKSHSRGCTIAKQAIDEALNYNLDALGDKPTKDRSTFILHLLQDNLMHWTYHLPVDAGDEI
ncbi:hypothetical protein SAY87_004775 [Trapa incisa]|uniref:14-3-3 domain-containing protein n=1 Tax=Trapa incisa TaxID=236973 RepID=A0AAN7PNA7_9MYRT|nr:hypothetical protein SAY87_004775 [Trapa incisa]